VSRLHVALLVSSALSLGVRSVRADDPAAPLGDHPSAWSKISTSQASDAQSLGERYLAFLSTAKTERDVISYALAQAQKAGFTTIDLFAAAQSPPDLVKGGRYILAERGKIAALVVVGSQPSAAGLRIVTAHVDAVRLDLKPNPVYGDANLALLKTQYYGDLKKYQWLSRPLELRGVVPKADGTIVTVDVGGDPADPVLVIPDVEAALASDVAGAEGEQVPGEALDPVVASTPMTKAAAGADPFVANVVAILAKKYGVTADDLAQAELELVPADPPRSVGLDAALVGGYGQNGRGGAFAAIEAITGEGQPVHTSVVLLVDKEEVGSEGATSASSSFFARVADLLLAKEVAPWSEQRAEEALAQSLAVYATAVPAVDPLYATLWEPQNGAFVSAGPVVVRAGDAGSETLAAATAALDQSGVIYQAGGGTRSLEPESGPPPALGQLAALGIPGVEIALPTLAAGAPYEMVSKVDLYEAVKAYRAVLAE
jgi:aspartyl aminopeptidase